MFDGIPSSLKNSLGGKVRFNMMSLVFDMKDFGARNIQMIVVLKLSEKKCSEFVYVLHLRRAKRGVEVKSLIDGQWPYWPYLMILMADRMLLYTMMVSLGGLLVSVCPKLALPCDTPCTKH